MKKIKVRLNVMYVLSAVPLMRDCKEPGARKVVPSARILIDPSGSALRNTCLEAEITWGTASSLFWVAVELP